MTSLPNSTNISPQETTNPTTTVPDLYFTGTTNQKPAAPVSIPAPDRLRQLDPGGYVADPGLVDAVNVALTLGQPLLLTGEPGTGKTQLAYRIAWELGHDEPLLFETKSTSTARDLFYTYDSLRRFHAAHTPTASQDNRDYIHYNALGLAILHANEEATIRDVAPSGFVHGGARRSVVLVDEVDKAPRDFPNDLLSELDQMYFRIVELGNVRVSAPPEFRPILIIASNSEKNLPDPFLRRCVYYHIPFPDKPRLEAIILKRLSLFGDARSPLLSDGIDFFLQLRERNVRKKPSTAELVNWLNVLVRRGADPARRLKEAEAAARTALSVLAKTADDLAEARLFADEFFKSA